MAAVADLGMWPTVFACSKIGLLVASKEVGLRIGTRAAIVTCPQRFQLIVLAPIKHMQSKSTLHLGCLSQLGAGAVDADESWAMARG